MGKRADLTPRKKAKIEALLKNTDLSHKEIANNLNICRKSVYRIKKKLDYGASLEVKRKGRCGRRRKSTAKDDRQLLLWCKRDRKLNSRQLCGMWNKAGTIVSDSTVRRRLINAGMMARRPRVKPKLTPAMIKKRWTWAVKHKTMSQDDWKRVVFSDEATFKILDDRIQYVRRRSHEENLPSCLVTRVKHPTQVMVWSCMSTFGVGRLHIHEGIMNQRSYQSVLEKRLMPQLNEWFPDGNCIYMHDGAPCHTAKAVSTYLKQNRVKVLDWAGNSPDLNPIENLWKVVKDRVSRHRPTTKTALIEALINVWHRDPEISTLCTKLIDGMTGRVEQLLKCHGKQTKY